MRQTHCAESLTAMTRPPARVAFSSRLSHARAVMVTPRLRPLRAARPGPARSRTSAVWVQHLFGVSGRFRQQCEPPATSGNRAPPPTAAREPREPSASCTAEQRGPPTGETRTRHRAVAPQRLLCSGIGAETAAAHTTVAPGWERAIRLGVACYEAVFSH